MLIPFNRHLLVEPIAQSTDTEPTVVLVPDSVTIRPDYSLVKLLAVAPDCEKFNGEVGHTLLVNSNMVEEIFMEIGAAATESVPLTKISYIIKCDHIEPEIFIALIYTESRWTPRAKSRANACGLTQVIPKWTGGRATGGRKYTCKELYDPVTSIRAGGQILNTWLYRYGRGDYKIGLCGYNAGYRCKGKNPNLKGKRYARIVLKRAKRIKQAVRKIKRENNRARVEE